MSHWKRNKQNQILLGLSLGIMAIASKPAMSLEAQNNSVSTEANDLLFPVELSQYFTNVSGRTYQLGQLDLEQFCRDFPFNSQCEGTIPATEGETPRSVPVPVPPPAPPENNQNNSISSSTQKTGWAIVPEISTLGLGGHLVRKIIPQINARLGVNTFGLGFEIEDSNSGVDTVYDADLNLLNVSTIVDFHPFKNSGFKISAGAIIANNDVEGTAIAEDEIEIGDQTFDASEIGSVDVDIEVTRTFAPYVGLGWGNAVAGNKGLGFWFNLGIMFGGSPEIEVNPNINPNLPPEQRQLVEEEVNDAIDEEVEQIEDDLAFIDIYPVVSLGVSFQF